MPDIVGACDAADSQRLLELLAERDVEILCQRRIIDQISVGVAVCDSEGGIHYVNEAVARMLGYSPQELVELCRWTRLTPPEYAPLDRRIVREVLETGSCAPYEKELFAKDGRRVPILVIGRSIEMPRLREPAIVAFLTDLSALKRAEAARRDSDNRFRMLAEAMPQIVWSATPDGAFDYFNSKWEEYTGLSRLAGLGWGWRRAIHPDDIEPTASTWAESLHTGRNYQIEHRLRRADGSYRWHLARSLPVQDEQGTIIRWLGTCTDIHESKLAEAAAHRASEAKSRFLAAASHDLRQPLHAVRLFLDVLAHTIHDPKQQDIVQKAVHALESGQDLLNALLDVSTLEAGTIPVTEEAVPAGPLLGRLADEYLPQAVNAGLALRHVPSSAVLRSDPVLLARILRNLLSNAVRYTRRGGILIGCRRAGKALRIEVWDTGIGIPADKTQAIFEDFYQIGNEERDRSCGLGLGLSTVERMARLLGHEIGVRSRPGRGSVFWVTVPAAAE